MILDGFPIGPILHAVMMRYPAPCNLSCYLGSGVTIVSGLVTAQVGSGTAQGVGVVGTLLGVAGMLLPLYFKDRSERRSQQAKDRAEALANDAEKAELRRQLHAAQSRLAEDDRRIKELEKIVPQVEANRQGLANTQPKADLAFEFLLNAGVIIDPPAQIFPVIPVRVLVVEDDVPTARALVEFLGRHKFAVDYASSVGAAIDRLSGPVPFDWMTLDLRIDGGKGEDVLEYVRRRRLSTRVAVTTGTPDRARIDALTPLRPDCVFPKPVNWTVLIETLRSEPPEDRGEREANGDAAGTT
jgi:ActR/RegA family two-component response regulator